MKAPRVPRVALRRWAAPPAEQEGRRVGLGRTEARVVHCLADLGRPIRSIPDTRGPRDPRRRRTLYPAGEARVSLLKAAPRVEHDLSRPVRFDEGKKLRVAVDLDEKERRDVERAGQPPHRLLTRSHRVADLRAEEEGVRMVSERSLVEDGERLFRSTHPDQKPCAAEMVPLHPASRAFSLHRARGGAFERDGGRADPCQDQSHGPHLRP